MAAFSAIEGVIYHLKGGVPYQIPVICFLLAIIFMVLFINTCITWHQLKKAEEEKTDDEQKCFVDEADKTSDENHEDTEAPPAPTAN
jgi:hypothetical protein